MIRLLIVCMLLFVLRPSLAEASVCAQDAEQRSAFTALKGDFGDGVVRSTSGVELLVELSVRVNSRVPAGKPSSPARVRHEDPVAADLLLAVRSRRLVCARELDLPCSTSPFAVYLPYHAEPPPLRS